MPAVIILLTICFSLLLFRLPVSRQFTDLARYSNNIVGSNNTCTNTNASLDNNNEDENALWFSQGVMRCWVCALCPVVKNGQKNENATSPRWCPVSVDIKASHTCVIYSVEKSFFSFGWLVDLLGKKKRVRRKWYRAGQGPSQQQQQQKQLRQTQNAAMTSSWIIKRYIYRGCATYEGFCHEIYKRSVRFGFINYCQECKGDMCNGTKVLKALPTLVAMYFFKYLVWYNLD